MFDATKVNVNVGIPVMKQIAISMILSFLAKRLR